ncbi:hypothetical protein IP84_16845 [beta proteobacterium AAP99]|nr:hypothetical protein IP84_16845 [beta proteobacterium AAP99]
MTDDLKELTRQAAVAMGLTPVFHDLMAGWWAVDKSKPKDHFGDDQGCWFDPLNNAEQQLEMRRVLRIQMKYERVTGEWRAWVWGTDREPPIGFFNPNDSRAVLEVAAEIGRRKEQGNGSSN